MRKRRLAAWTLGILGAVLLVAGLFVAWVLRSGGGRDFALARVVSSLPPGSLAWERAEGSLAGPLVLHGVRYAKDGVIVELRRLSLDLAPFALTSRHVHIEDLQIDGGRIELPPGDDTDEPWPERLALPETLPTLGLPVSIRLDRLQARDLAIEQAGKPVLQVQTLDAAGDFSHGRLGIERLALATDRGTLTAQGELDSQSRWQWGLQVQLDLAGAEGVRIPAQVGLSGFLEDFTLTVRADLPEPARLTLSARGGLPDPRWKLSLSAPRIEPARFGAEGAPFALALGGEGTLEQATLAGSLQREGDEAIVLDPSVLRYAGGVFEVAPLQVSRGPARLTANGRVDLKPAQPVLAMDVAWTDVETPSADGRVVVSSDGRARVDGPLDDFALTAAGTVERASESAEVRVAGRGSRSHLAFEQLAMTTPRGSLQARGRVAWEPQVTWDLDATLEDFDPGFLAPDFPGSVDATLESEGSLVDGKPQGRLRVDPLGGELRGRALGGRVDAEMQLDRSGRADIDLRLGSSRVTANGRWDRQVDARIEFAPLQLADALPDLAGEVRGTLVLDGPRDAPGIDADLDANGIALAGFAAETLHLRGSVQQFANGSMSMEGKNVDIAGQRFGTLSLSAEGSRAEHAISLALGDGVAGIALELAGGERDGDWRGTLRALRIEPRERAAWTLRAPAALAYDFDTGETTLDGACLAESGSSLCIDADWKQRAGDARFTLRQFPLATLDPFLADALDQPASAFGVLDARGEMQRNAEGVVTGTLAATSPRGGLRLDPQAERELLVFENLRLDARLDTQALRASAHAMLARDGRLEARLETQAPFAEDGALAGEITARVRDLTFLELFSDQLVDPEGALDARLAIAGTRGTPSLAGSATLSGFGGELPALGLDLSEGEIAVTSRGSSAADIRGQVRSGQGVLRVEGRYDAAATADATLALTLKGDTVTLAGLPELTAAASPDLTVTLKDDRLRVRGTVAVPLARIGLEKLQTATRPSTDVVIVDAGAVEAEQGGIALDSDITVTLGDDVRLEGFGLKGKLAGQVAVRDRPGRATVARGGLEVSGEYKAYGQDLEITRGRLAYASTPIDNPSIDVRAQRKIEDVTVGVQVRGTALAPELTLWSNPSLDQAEQLSYLVLGRPLRSASQADGTQLTQAAAAIGGNLLAKRLGARMGLDEVGVADNRALGGAALTVGKYLSPKLYVSYGVALFGTGQVVTFKYLLSRVWSIQIDSGTENRAALNYRLER